ncbi:MAG: methyltransferase domain-containing protein [Pseudomonadota bacterium]
MSSESYDQIAAVYATDMGQSMAFDDISYYRALCQQRGGRALGLGCGTGRILLPLLQSGINIAGVDQSPGMLAQLRTDAQALHLQPDVSQGTLTDFSTPPCNTVLAPYSVVTYLTDESQLAAFFHTAQQALDADGLLVVDTFIPRPVTSFTDFRLDYRRPHQQQTLQREKRIMALGSCNRIERRYSLLDAAGAVEKSWTTVDVIRPWTEGELVAAATAAGFALVAKHGDFRQGSSANDQFVVLHFARS